MEENKDIFAYGFDANLNRNVFLKIDSPLVYDNLDVVNPSLLTSGPIQGNLTLADGNLQTGNFVSGVSGIQMTSTGYLEANEGVFRGSLSGVSGTFGTITAGAISGVAVSGSTITGSTLTTGTTGNNIDLTAGRMSQRYDAAEVAYSDVGANGGWFGLKDITGTAIGHWNVRNSGADVNFICDVGDLYLQAADDIIIVGSAGNDIYPATPEVMSLGLGSNKWSDVQSVLINGADFCFDNGVRITEEEDYGISFYNPEDEKIMMLDKEGNLWLKGSIKTNTDFKQQFPFYRKGNLIKK